MILIIAVASNAATIISLPPPRPTDVARLRQPATRELSMAAESPGCRNNNGRLRGHCHAD